MKDPQSVIVAESCQKLLSSFAQFKDDMMRKIDFPYHFAIYYQRVPVQIKVSFIERIL